ncbi:MAG: DUF2961 domain-containing protein [Armatimonadetes bacterium]|nr:DUF2961 domain-containing protein [Armatimonadota bacterium]
MKRTLLICIFALVACNLAYTGQTLTYLDLVSRLTDLEHLATLPPPGEKCAQWSSYDRASYYDEKTGKYVGWDANGDGNGVIRVEDDHFVVAEIEGPGCIWRIWSALAGQGHVKIYLDGATDPTVDLPFIGFFDLKNEPFVYPALVHQVAKGFNCYVPIPFQKSCKITMEKDWGAYYHFTYSTFPKDTQIPTFSRNLSLEEKEALAEADRFLRKRLGTDPAGHREGEETVIKRISIPPGQKETVLKLMGARAITGIWMKVSLSNPDDPDRTLRNTILQIKWDGEKSPSVWAPIGDFFGTGPGMNKYKSLPLGVTDDGMYCYWYMPFSKSAEIEIINEGRKPFSGEFTITHSPITKPIQELARFHAKWHRDAFLPKDPERWIDWPMLVTQGKGRYCGVALEVWNPRGGWWGEGDEKFFVDGEKFPSTIGTGSEDYFGYAWCTPELFQNAYHNQTKVFQNIGHVAVNRWHIADSVPFQTSFEGCIEKYFLNDRPTLYASTVYWYLAPGGVDPYKPVPPKERIFYITAEPPRVPGAIEGENMKILSKTGGNPQIQQLGERWSGEAHLWWINAKPGDKLDLELPIKGTGKYELVAALTKAIDYGIVQFYLDGQKIGNPIDLYNNGVVPTGEISLGTFNLSKGSHKLTVEIIGANEKAIKSFMFGLDYIKLKKAKR